MNLDHNQFAFSWKKNLLLNLSISFIYILIGNATNYFSSGLATVDSLCAPSGLVLGFVVVFGIARTLPGIIAGITFLTFQEWSYSFVCFGLIFSAVIEVMIAAVLLRSFGDGKYRFKKPKEIFGLIIIAAVVAPCISSTFTVGILFIGDAIKESQILSTWIVKFVSNSLGILVVTPIMVNFFSSAMKKANVWEAIILYTAVGISTKWGFEGATFRLYLIIPLLLWSGLRFGLRGVAIGSIIIAYVSAWKTIQFNPDNDLLIIQSLIAGASLIGYFIASVVEAQVKAEEKERELSIKDDALAILDQSLHKSPIGFALIDKDLKYVRVNEILAKINGLDANFHLGKSVREINSGHADEFIPLIQDVLNTGRSHMNIPFTGHLLAGLISYYPVRHPATNEIFAVAFSFQDITELSKIQTLLTANEERLRFAQEAGKIGAFEWNVETNQIFWTQELENIYGLYPGAFEGHYASWLKWIHPNDLADFNGEINKVLLEEKEFNFQFRIITGSNETRWILARGKVIRENGSIKKLVGINIDITEQKMTEHKLRLVEANLLHALSVRDEFMAIASHELKTPLTSLKLSNQFLQRGLVKNNDQSNQFQKVNTFIERNCVQIDRLTRLVDDMLDISRMRTGKFTLRKEKFELTQILNDIIYRTRHQFEDSGSGLPIIEKMDFARGEWDPLRIDQVFTNIITNAIRYGQGTPIRISVINLQDCVRVIVKDHGTGIPKSDHEKIFERYERGLLNREVSGLGLGLYITKQIIEAHGGSIWVESELNQGAKFFVDLPIIRSPLFLKPEITDAFETLH